jgi:hypothetical protein
MHKQMTVNGFLVGQRHWHFGDLCISSAIALDISPFEGAEIVKPPALPEDVY